jgi:hypothetical protein
VTTTCPTCGTAGYALPPESEVCRLRPDGRRSPTDHCWDFGDGFDGFLVHAEECPYVGMSWLGGSSCIRPTRWRGPTPGWAL